MASTINYSLGENLLTADQCITSMTYKVIGEPIRISDGDWHGKLNELGELFNKNNLKKMIKKGVHAAVLGAALATGTAMVGCKQPEDPTIEDPNNNPGGNGQGGNQQGGNGQGGNEQGDNGQGGNQQGGNGQGGNQQGGNTSTNDYKPYDRNLDNGYVLHNFFGEKANFPKKTIVADVNNCLGKAKTYMMGLVDGFSQSLSNRPDAKAYFQNYINELKNNKYYTVDNETSYSNLDPLIMINSQAGEYIFKDIIKSLGATQDSTDFYYAYLTLGNEAFKEGYATEFNSFPDATTAYNRKRDLMTGWDCGFDFNNDVDNNNCQQVVNKLHTMATKAANNMGNDITADDLRRVVNLSLTANSMVSMHNLVRSNLDHSASCGLGLTIEQTMSDTFDELLSRNAVQSQGLTR